MSGDEVRSLNDRLRHASGLIHAGQYEEAKQIVTALPREDPRLRSALSGLLIDLGSDLNDDTLVNEGISYIEESLGREQEPNRLAVEHYNLANAFAFLYQREWSGLLSSVTSPHIQQEKHHLREAARLCNEPDLLKQIYVNLGNCLDHLNRGAEALVYYSLALKIDPRMGMAIGNRAMAMTKFADISGSYRQSIYFSAYDDLRDLAEQAGPIEYGGDIATRMLGQAMENIEAKFQPEALVALRSRDRVIHPRYDARRMSNFERFYTKFCLDNHLFLNFHIHDNRCEAAIDDPIFINHGASTQAMGLAKYINQMKEDYASARYILARSQLRSRELSSIDSRVVYASTPDRAVFSLYDGLLKTAFEEAYSILDKIVGFLNDYYNMGLRFKLYFTSNRRPNFWEMDQGSLRPELVAKHNPSLYALYDIFKDFDSGYYSRLTKIRNGLAHRKLAVRRSRIDPAESGDLLEEIYVDDMRDATLELFQVTKSAVIYLINAVNFRRPGS